MRHVTRHLFRFSARNSIASYVTNPNGIAQKSAVRFYHSARIDYALARRRQVLVINADDAQDSALSVDAGDVSPLSIPRASKMVHCECSPFMIQLIWCADERAVRGRASRARPALECSSNCDSTWLRRRLNLAEARVTVFHVH